LAQELVLGNLEARRDWGFAPEYVEAIWRMLQRDEPEDFVIGTGEDHSVQDLVDVAFDHIGLDPERFVRQDPSLVRPAEVDRLIADSSKAGRALGWEPRVGFEELVRMMVDADLELLTGGARPAPRAGTASVS
jgi:GDPmannose 4,6-dehydratase